jgi:ubiquinol-cytochrome c reductase cytochrome c1 subunit
MLPLFMRSFKFLVGLAFVGVLLWALLWTIVGLMKESPPPSIETSEFHHHPKELSLASDGPLGKFDNRQLQRGFQVYKEVCSACHSLGLVSFRELQGIGYNEAEVKKIAKDWAAKQPTFDPKSGEHAERDNLPSDRIPHVYYAGSGNPPDLTLITKARHGGAAYVYSLLTGYEDAQPPALLKAFPSAKTPDGLYYNPYFPTLNLAMPEPLTDTGQVAYLDGTKETKKQKAKDVAAFLVWAAEPTLETRREVGLAVVLFLLITTVLAYGAYLTVWRGVKH